MTAETRSIYISPEALAKALREAARNSRVRAGGGTMTLTDFLLARIAEDEAVAREASDLGDGPTLGWIRITPARVLAECEAKRRIVERHTEREVSPSCSECGGYTATTDPVRGIVHHGYAIPWPCPTLRLLALPYADHPDYDPSWRP